MIEIGTLLQDRYLIEKQIGVGGMGAVYLAVDQRFENYVAIKQTFYNDDELSEAFEREARLLNSLLHPVLPHVSDFFTENGGHFLVMQYIEGEDLFAILKREGAFPLKEVLRWTDQLLDALDYLHSQEPPITHRDIKPHNLKITPRGDVILLDFGLAKRKSEHTTNVKSVFGYSRKYSPLEQIQGTGTDGRSDLFALAATAFHLLTGKPPIDVLARAAEIIVGNPDPLPLVSELNPEVPESVANILHTALSLNAARRFVSAKAMRQALENAANGAAPEEIEVAPEEILPVIPGENAVVISPENEDFPALEAFAAGSGVDPAVISNAPVSNASAARANENEELLENKISIPVEHREEISSTVREAVAPQITTPPLQTPVIHQEILPQQTIIVDDAPTRVIGNRRKRSPLTLVAAAAVLLILAFVAAGYFISGSKSPDSEQATTQSVPATESSSETEQTATALESPTPEEIIDEPAIPENLEQAKTKTPAIAKTMAKKEAADEPEPIESNVPEKTKTPPAETQAQRTETTAQNQRRQEAPKRNQTAAPRVIRQEPVPDIESVFTGRPSWNRDEKERRREERIRQNGDVISEDEFREMRRQRREERRRRQQHKNTFPF